MSNSNNKMTKGDEHANMLGEIIIDCFKLIGKVISNYFQFSFRGIKKVFLNRKRVITYIPVLIEMILIIQSVNQYMNLVEFNKESLIRLVAPFVFLPFLHLLIFNKKDSIDYNVNDEFLNYYGNMGFKEDITKGLEYPYCLGLREDKQYIIYVFKANKNKIDGFKRNVDILEEIVNCEVKEIRKNENNKSLIEVVFRNHDYEVDRLDIEKVDIEEDRDDCIPISQDINWYFRKSPHLLINGGTGGGKTFFIFYIVKVLLELKAVVKILDPKHSHLSKLRFYLGQKNVVYKHTDIAKVLKDVVKELYRRSDEMDKVKATNISDDYKNFGFKPMFLIFDEMMSFMRGGVDDKLKKEANTALLDIVAMGRELGIFAIVAMQRGSTKSIDGDVRGQFHARCTLGKMDVDGYKMAFGDNYKLKKSLKDKGSGFFQIEDVIGLEEPTEFYTPYIDKKYNILIEIEKLVNENYSEIEERKEKIEEKKIEETKPIPLSQYKDMKMTKEK